MQEISALTEAVTTLQEETASMREEVMAFRNLAFKHRMPLGFLRELEHSFECCVCKKSPSTPPIIGCSKCGSPLGCKGCVDTWYSGQEALTKTCPKCRCERGLAHTFTLRGFDSLVEKISSMYSEDEPTTD